MYLLFCECTKFKQGHENTILILVNSEDVSLKINSKRQKIYNGLKKIFCGSN